MSESTRAPGKPRLLLVMRDIHLSRDGSSTQRDNVQATVDCERWGCTLPVETCVSCERFARIEVHEAGYGLLCRSAPLNEESVRIEGQMDAAKASGVDAHDDSSEGG